MPLLCLSALVATGLQLAANPVHSSHPQYICGPRGTEFITANSINYRIKQQSMAELYVERKRKSPVLWILLALILLAVIGYLVWANSNRINNEDTTTEQTTTTTTTSGAPAGQ